VTKKLCALVLVLSAAPALAADAAWQPVLGDLCKGEKPGFGLLRGVVVNHDTGCVFVNLAGRDIYCSGAGATKFNPLSARAAAGPDRKFVLALTEAKAAGHGRVRGKNDKHVFELTRVGVVESTDGGATWSKPVAPPKELKGAAGAAWIEYDPKNDILYVMKPGGDLYKLARRK
jgi:hypothetical protein